MENFSQPAPDNDLEELRRRSLKINPATTEDALATVEGMPSELEPDGDEEAVVSAGASADEILGAHRKATEQHGKQLGATIAVEDVSPKHEAALRKHQERLEKTGKDPISTEILAARLQSEAEAQEARKQRAGNTTLEDIYQQLVEAENTRRAEVGQRKLLGVEKMALRKKAEQEYLDRKRQKRQRAA